MKTYLKLLVILGTLLAHTSMALGQSTQVIDTSKIKLDTLVYVPNAKPVFRTNTLKNTLQKKVKPTSQKKSAKKANAAPKQQSMEETNTFQEEIVEPGSTTGPDDTEEDDGEEDESGNAEPSGPPIEVGKTPVGIDVSPSGAAVATIPINIPVGVNGFTPELSLIYSSQSNNGVAGYGWSIGGLSSISRIPATKFHSGRIGGINIDDRDYFALDGQRLLLKSGTYGASGSEYQTESYSNLRIFSRGSMAVGTSSGPEYFEVWYPDGSKAFYGTTISSRTALEYGITYRESNLGARIEYFYSSGSNALQLLKIRYGSLGANQVLNTLDFGYQTAERSEQAYVGGQNVYRGYILNKISVNVNATPVRHYKLGIGNSIFGYQRLTSITENNADETRSLGTVTFSYTETGDIVQNKSISNLGISGIESRNSDAIFGDFTGNGTMDFILRPTEKDKFFTFFDLDPNNSNVPHTINTGAYKEIFPVKWLTHNSKMLPSDGFAVIKRPSYTSYKFELYSSGTTVPVYNQYDREWNNVPKGPGYYSECDNQFHEGPPLEYEFVSGDFNGDGLTDIIALNKPYYNYVSHERFEEGNPWDEPGNPWDPQEPATGLDGCVKEYANMDYSQVHLINLDRRITTNFITTLGYLNGIFSYDDKLYTGDFNGDGKTDILHVSSGKMYVYSLNDTNSSLQLLWQTNDTRIVPTEVIFIGDFNGDGKIDVMISTGTSNLFATFMSNGKAFIKHEQTYPFYKGSQTWWSQTGIQTTSFMMPTDINGDGKTDLASVYTLTTSDNAADYIAVAGYISSGYSADYGLSFVRKQYSNIYTHLKHFPIPVILTTDKVNHNLEVGVLSDNTLHLFAFSANVQAAKQLTAINNNQEIHNISYAKLMSNSNNYSDIPLYQTNYAQTFPNVDIETAPDFSVVSKIIRKYGQREVQQVFGYGNAVVNTEGLGFLGFGKVVRSNWHINSSDPNRMFDLSISDPQLRGAVTKTFKVRDLYINSSIVAAPISSDGATINDYISRSDISYQSQLLSNKVFVNAVTATASKDLLTGVSSQSTTEYDSYYNGTKITTNINGIATKVEDATYENNPNGYYIGRPLTQKSSITTGGDTHSTEVVYNYSGYLPTQIKRKGHGTPWLTENLSYDVFGNITQTSVVTTSGTRSSSTQYDLTGRFPISQTNVEGLTSTSTYDAVTGNVLSTTNVYGQTTTYTYDSWNRLLETTDYLGKKVYNSYDSHTNGYVFTQTDDEGREKNTYTNHLGQTTEVTEKTLTGSYVGSAIDYDGYGRAYRQSQPAAPGSYNQWNETEFDEYGRIKKTTAYTGKVANYSYSGLSTTVNDGTKSVTSTKNALGQIASVQDPGGTINYSYYAHGGLKSANFDGSVQALEYDGWGRKTKLTDPSAGMYTYAYNGFGEITQETTPKGATTYTYDAATGRLTAKTLTGDATSLSYAYSYNSTTKLLENMSFTNADGNNASYSYTYDSQKRLAGTVENNLHAVFTKNFTYDAFGRISTEGYQAKDKASNVTANRTVAYTYQNGDLLQAVDQTSGQLLAKTNTLTANGQLASELQGNSLKTTYTYDAFNLPQSMVTERIGSSPATLMNLGFSFDAQRGNLNSRSNSALGWNETFLYDNLDRLIAFSDNNDDYTQDYDARGRITLNSQLGNYSYSGTGYRQTELTNPTAAATSWYQDRSLQLISFNAFKKPVNINEQGKEQIDFHYNASLQRAHMYYGSTDADKMLRPMRRHYSEDGGMEITKDLVSNTTSFVFYLTGDAYSAPAIFKETHNGSGTSQNLYYLHRDHLGSINLISDVNGNAVEKRQFDAWGNIVALTDGNGNALTAFMILDRGYTGHEHLLNVGLINMNGRMYDPKLHRFLSPDNFVQNAFNTQNFNRYGYVMNNPLVSTDPDGEWILQLLVGAGVSVLTNGINNAINSQPFFKGAPLAALSGGIAGGVAMYIGNETSKISGTLGKVVMQSLGHGVLGGTLSVINGGDFYSGFASGALGSVAAWGAGELLGGSSGLWNGVGMIAAGSLVGGVSAEISGGSFWDGVKNGAISSGLNHFAHTLQQRSKHRFSHKQLEKMFEIYENSTKDYGNAADFYALIGGELGDWAAREPQDFENTCAARLSRALNYAGFEIPKGTPNTYQGGDGKYYFIQALAMKNYLTKIWGTPGRPPTVYKLRNAVYYQDEFGGNITGHLDIMLNKRVAGHIYNNPTYWWH